MKNEMYYGYEKDFKSFEEFTAAVEEYIDYYNNRRIQAKNKMDDTCAIQDGIHVFSLVQICVQDSGYISHSDLCLCYLASCTYLAISFPASEPEDRDVPNAAPSLS